MGAAKEFSLEDKEKTIGARLCCYAGGGGYLSFVYERNDPERGRIATGDRVTVRDIKWYLKHRDEYLRSNNYFIGQFGDGPYFLFQPCRRLAPDELSVGGKSYRYEKAGHVLMLFSEEGREVKNLNILSVVKFYLENEQALDELIYRGGL